MRWRRIIGRREAIGAALIVVSGAMLGGCRTPASVGPLLDVVDRVLADEQRLLTEDGQRQNAWFDQQRQTLAAAFEADLVDRELTVDWVQTHTIAYVAAREALLAHELELHRQRETRRENLQLAARAQHRAKALLERHDELLGPVGNLRTWFDRMTGIADKENDR